MNVREFSVITYTHLRSEHCITMEEYRAMFPDAELTSREAKQAMREAMLGNQSAVGSQSMLGHVHTKEAKQEMREAALGNQRALGHVCVHMEETKQAIREAALTNWKNPNYVRSVFRYRKPNERELQLQSVLDRHFPDVWKFVGDGQVWIEGKNPDFMNVNSKKQVIEVFGYHWHDPSYFPNRASEEELIAHYKSCGFDCIVFWEYDVYNEEEVVRRIRGKFSCGGK